MPRKIAKRCIDMTVPETSAASSQSNVVHLSHFTAVPDRSPCTYQHVLITARQTGSLSLGRLISNILISWLAFHEKTLDDEAKEFLQDGFKSRLENYMLSIENLDFSMQATYRYAIEKLSSIYCNGSPTCGHRAVRVENPYWDLVFEAVHAKNIKGDMKQNILRADRSNAMPRSVKRVQEIAKLLELDEKKLVELVWLWKPKLLFDLNNAEYDWATTHHAMTQLAYAMKILPPQVETILDPFLAWRSNRLPKTIIVHHLDGSEYELDREGVWTIRGSQSKDEIPDTERLYREFLSSFFGFCALPTDHSNERLRGLGIDPTSLRLSHLLIAKNVVAYADFQKVRNGRYDHTGLKKLRQDWCLMIGSQNSYGRHAQVELYDDLCAALGNEPCPSTSGEWSSWCHRQLREIDKWIDQETEGRTGKQKYRKARSTEEGLLYLLEKDCPMADVVWPTVFWLQKNSPPPYYPLYDRMRHGQKVFMLAALSAEPHRIENWQGMLWGRNLYKREGIWYVTIPKDDFKNRRILKYNYRACIETTAQPFFENYYKLWMEAFGLDPLLKENRNVASYVLAPWPGLNPGKKPCHAIVRQHLVWLDEIWGVTVGPHAMRHIWATDWLKRHPDDFSTVAGKLNDSISVIMEAYGHLRSQDHARRADAANTGLAQIAEQNLAKQIAKTAKL